MAAAMPLMEAELARREKHLARLEAKAQRLESVISGRAHPFVRTHAAAAVFAERAVDSIVTPPATGDFAAAVAWAITRNTLVSQVTLQLRRAAVNLYRRSASRHVRATECRATSGRRGRGASGQRRRSRFRRPARSPGRPRPTDDPDLNRSARGRPSRTVLDAA
jgi:hypothetical protein